MTMTDFSTQMESMRRKRLSYIPAEEAKEYGFDLDPGWAVKVDWEADQPKYTYVSPEKWEFADLVYGDEGLMDYLALSPEGKRHTKSELDICPHPYLDTSLSGEQLQIHTIYASLRTSSISVNMFR